MQPGDLVRIKAATSAWMTDPCANEIGMIIRRAPSSATDLIYWQIMFPSETRAIAEQALELINAAG